MKSYILQAERNYNDKESKKRLSKNYSNEIHIDDVIQTILQLLSKKEGNSKFNNINEIYH